MKSLLVLGLLLAATVPPQTTGEVTPIRDAAELDTALEAAWTRASVSPAGPASPQVWLRRAWLDLAGVIPTSADVRAFSADASPAARARVIDQLLAGHDWSGRWGRVLSRTLIAPRAEPDTALAKGLEKWLTERLATGATWPSIVRALVAAGGGDAESAAAFRAQFAETPYEIAGQLGSAVLGMRLRCAQCHDDPLHGWKVADYYGLAAFFGNPRRISVPAKLLESWRAGKVRNFYELVMMMPEMKPRGADHRWVREEIKNAVNELRELNRMGIGPAIFPQVDGVDWAAFDVYRIHAQRRAMNMEGFGRITNILSDKDGGELMMPALPSSPLAAPDAPPKGKPVPPRWPASPELPPPPPAGRRAALAAWLGDPANRLVARAFVNRVWYELMGHGLVEPVDEVVRPGETPHAEVLDRLAAGFSYRNGNVKWLLATILATRAYGEACAREGASLPLPSRPLTRPHYGMEIELGAAPVTPPHASVAPPPPPEKAVQKGGLLPMPPPEVAASEPSPASAAPSPAPSAASAATEAPVRVDPETLGAVRLARPLDAAEVEASLRRATGRETGSPELTKALTRTFEPNAGVTMIDEGGASSGNLPRGLFLLTGPELQQLVEEAPVLQALASERDASAALDELFLRTVARLPEPAERARLAKALASLPDTPEHRRPWADVLWALVSSAEFLSNH